MADTVIYGSDVRASISKYVETLSAWLQIRDVDSTPGVVRDVIGSNLTEKSADLIIKLLADRQWTEKNLKLFLNRLENGTKGELS